LGSRVRLVVPDLATLEAALAGPRELARALDGYEVAEGWEAFPGSVSRTRDELAADPGAARWGTRLFVLDDLRMLGGWGGFKGAPADGTVELGYAIAPGLRGRGIATDAVRELLSEAFSASEVRSVIAHTLPESNASTRVLQKTGFVLDGDAMEGDRPVWRWRHDRPQR
jgi:RimJ/RimL family protein N-acetyltransferase